MIIFCPNVASPYRQEVDRVLEEIPRVFGGWPAVVTVQSWLRVQGRNHLPLNWPAESRESHLGILRDVAACVGGGR